MSVLFVAVHESGSATKLPWEALRSKVCLLQLSGLDADIASTAGTNPRILDLSMRPDGHARSGDSAFGRPGHDDVCGLGQGSDSPRER